MSLRLQTERFGNVSIFHCEGRIVFGRESAALHEQVLNMLSDTPNIVVDLHGIEHIDSEAISILVGLLASARNRGGDLKLVSPNQHVVNLIRRANLHTLLM